jgi:LPS-assembly protein
MRFHGSDNNEHPIYSRTWARGRLALLAFWIGGTASQAALAAGQICPPDLLPVRVLGPEQAGKKPAELPVELEADRVERVEGGPVVFTGRAEAVQGARSILGDKLTYSEENNEIEAEGNVVLRTPGGDRFATPFLKYNVDSGIGSARETEYRIADRARKTKDPATVAVMARGKAEAVDIAGQDLVLLKNATYTNCVEGQDDVMLNADEVELDFASGIGKAKNLKLEFKDVPIFYAPRFSFPISDERKSGFLFPTFGGVAGSGFVFGIPYYWNIAPNYDATITPQILSQRGIKLDGEFRYLQRKSNGIVSAAWLPHDSEFEGDGNNRGAFSWNHFQRFSKHWHGDIDYQWASDGDYFDDFSSDLGISAQTHLPQSANLVYKSKVWKVKTSVLRYQTIDDTISESSKPHERLPRVTFAAKIPYESDGPRYGFEGEVTNFEHSTRVAGTRVDLTPSVEYPIETIYGYVKPRVEVRHTSYHGLDNIGAGEDDNPSRTVGVFSVDSGLFFERDTSWLNRPFIQTLEPRVFYVYANRENQDELPNFDTGTVGFNNLSDFFRTNRFTGADRVEDANRVTVAVTSRMIDADNGKEWMRGSLGQIYFLDDREVTLRGGTETRSTSDILASGSAQLTDDWAVSGFYQWDPQDTRTEQAKFTVKFWDRVDRQAYVSYRYTRDSTDQVDIGAAWPLAPRWTLSGRYLYSFEDEQTLEAAAKLRYNACCWAVHIGAQRRVDNRSEYRNSILIGLELTGLAKIATGF